MYKSLNPIHIFRGHCVAIACLAAAHWIFALIYIFGGHDHVFGLRRLFLLEGEANVPAFFSALALIAAAALACIIARMDGTDRSSAKRWLVIGGLLAFMALDEATSIHELLIQLGAKQPESGVLYYIWVIPYGILALTVGLLLLPFWLHLPAPTKTGLAGAAILYCGGALGMEMLESSLVARAGETAYGTWQMSLLITVEEVAEMLAVAVLVRTLLNHLARAPVPVLALRFGADQRSRTEESHGASTEIAANWAQHPRAAAPLAATLIVPAHSEPSRER